MIDVLHTIDLGIGVHITGNIFWSCMMMRVWPDGTHEQRIEGLDAAIHAHYKETRETSRLRGRLTVHRLHSDGG